MKIITKREFVDAMRDVPDDAPVYVEVEGKEYEIPEKFFEVREVFKITTGKTEKRLFLLTE